MNKISILLVFGLFLMGFTQTVQAQDVVDATTLNNKIMAGYQGWFGAPGDGSGYGWIHWGDGGGNINAKTVTIDYWLDMREYDSDELFETDFVYNDLTKAGLFSSYTRKTVDRHVKWMKDYGIDGVFVQRFISSALARTNQRDTVLQNVRYGAEKYGRVFANMYDMSGGKPETFVEDVKNDWIHLVDDLKITESPSYLHHNGLPVLSLWGVNVGGSSGVITAQHWNELLQWFTVDAPEKYRVTLKAGVGNGWKTDGPEWQTVYDMFEFISPWSVGRYRDNSSADNFRDKYYGPDLTETASRDVGYIPVVFPGFSWANLYEGNELNSIPRNGGKFFWRQFYNAIDAGCNMVYIAMFDEVDEGTAIFKLAENKSQTPTTGQFVTLDIDGYDLPSDWYLKLAGEATKMLRGDIALSSNIPIVAYPDNSEFVSQDVPTTLSPGATTSVSITMKNNGTTNWTNADNIKLAYFADSALNTWGITQVELGASETINPGESKTFTFDITAPAKEGAYNFQWSVMKEGVKWMGEHSEKRIINVASSINYLDDCDALTDWTSSVNLVLNSTDNQQGLGCIEFVGSTDKEYEKIFATAYNSGLKPYDARLQFWYYISDPSLMNSYFTVGLGSGGDIDQDEYTWNLRNLSSGWNLISLNIKSATVTGTPDLNAINWFRITNPKTGEVTTRVDEIQLFDRFAGAVKYQLTVNDGTGSGQYTVDAIIEITANEAPVGHEFSGWKVIGGQTLFENDKAISTKVRMFDEALEISPVYKVLGAYLDDCDELTGWGSSAALALNTTDQKEGAGCIEFTGDQTDEFKKTFSPAYNSGATVESGRLEFWYYISDASVMGNNQVELGSAGGPDQNEYNWNLSGLSNGWNFISLNFSEAGSTEGEPDLSAINWFRLYNFKSGPATIRIDAIEIVDPNGGERFALTVKNGTGDGMFFSGTNVTIKADPEPNSYLFDKWVIEEGNPVIADSSAKMTTLTMGEGNTVVTATYKEVKSYELIVNNGSGDGFYKPGTFPVIEADEAPDGKEFDRWEVNTNNAALSNETSTLTYFAMPEEDVAVTAMYTDVVSVSNAKLKGLNIYPNPANNEITVDVQLNKATDLSLWIIDLSGRNMGVRLNNSNLTTGKHTLNIPVSALKPGTYIIKLTIANKNYSELLMIK
jgi:hypothetical protein